MTISALGDSAMMISLGDRLDEATLLRVRTIVAELEHHRPAGVADIVGAFASVAVYGARTGSCDFEALKAALEHAVTKAEETAVSVTPREREVPVCYGGDHGPDLADVARHTGLTEAEVIAAHSGAQYRVQAIGFAPGFPYLSGLPDRLATPRRATPRASVPAGSVGIGGAQTGVYPFSTPGGWNLIGRTPRRLFDVGREEPAWLQAGDRVSFRAIEPAEFGALQQSAEREHRDTWAKNGREDGAPVRVVRAGMFTTVQDCGREGLRAQGVAMGGAADAFALRVANLLVGNADDAAALEFTLQGPTLMFSEDAVVAFAGGDFGLPRWRPLRVRAGDTLHIGPVQMGCRGYLAIAGGVCVPRVLGSRSTDLRAGFGGFGGRALHDGDVLSVGRVERHLGGHWWLDQRMLPGYASTATVRVVDGAQAEEFGPEWLGSEFSVSPRSDRMGVRLQGARLARTSAAELLSAPVAPGTIQVPPDGQPIVLLADAQTIGGYPKIGHVITADLPLMAQLKPGDHVRFSRVSLEEARAALHARERSIGLLREGMAQKISR